MEKKEAGWGVEEKARNENRNYIEEEGGATEKQLEKTIQTTKKEGPPRENEYVCN